MSEVRFRWVDWADDAMPGRDLHEMMAFCRDQLRGQWSLRIHNAAGRAHGILQGDAADVTFRFDPPANARAFRKHFAL